jgi:hypothetical protein
MDYYTVVIGPGTFNYSLSHGRETVNISAICEYGKNFLIKNCVYLISLFHSLMQFLYFFLIIVTAVMFICLSLIMELNL